MLIMLSMQRLHRRDSAPNRGFKKSLNNPTAQGPKPNPTMFIKKMSNAEAVLRILNSDMLWACAKLVACQKFDAKVGTINSKRTSVRLSTT